MMMNSTRNHNVENISQDDNDIDEFETENKITVARSCSDLASRSGNQWTYRASIRHLTGNSNLEIPLIGQCRSCSSHYKCNCCRQCNHTSIFYTPAPKPRTSNITFSTVTSATGLPTIAAELSRPRSSSHWKSNERESSQGVCYSRIDGINLPGNANEETAKFRKGAENSASADGSSNMPKLQHQMSAAHSEGGHDVGKLESSQRFIKVRDGTVFSCKEIEKDAHLQRIWEWSFPIFSFAEKNKSTVLSKLSYAVFAQFDLFRIFRLPLKKFFNFFHALENGYWNIPYHNRIHAADVVHGCFYLTSHPVAAFANNSYCGDSVPHYEKSVLPLSSSMSTLELMALFTAAAMHDYDHPGRTNAFLVACEDPKAILYNDRSVLENHHASESWRLLSKPGNNFIDTLDAAETKRFRYLVLEYILATDLKQHFDIIVQFNEKAAAMDLSSETDRVLISQMIIKFSDVNSPSKPYPLHRKWTDRICEEFYEQGDEERMRGMAISPYMDRNDPAVAKLQDSFIAHIINPLAIAMSDVELLPILPGLEDSELLINLKHNHLKWLAELEYQDGKMHSVHVNDMRSSLSKENEFNVEVSINTTSNADCSVGDVTADKLLIKNETSHNSGKSKVVRICSTNAIRKCSGDELCDCREEYL